MNYSLRSLRYCPWCASRFPPALRRDAIYCSGRCRVAAHRAEHAKRSDGTDPQAGPDPALASPGSHRQEVEGALLQLAGEAVEVISDALAEKDTSVAEWIVERAVVRHSKPGDPAEKSARMRDEDARAELQRAIDSIAARLEEERDTGVGAGSG